MKLLKQFSCCIILTVIALLLSSCTKKDKIPDTPLEINGLSFLERVQNTYATQFVIDRYQDNYSVIHTAQGVSYLLVPKDKKVPENLNTDSKILHTPVENVYMPATAVMGLFDALHCGKAVRFTGTKADGWYIDYPKTALENGDMLYAGKYSQPDYELLLSKNCQLAIQSTMIEHTPDVKEKLEELGITVFVDYSSYENHPLGRCEWIKVYGEMLHQKENAKSLFDEQQEKITHIQNTATKKTVAYFYINNKGQIVTRKSDDYISKMIELAGGENIFANLESENFSSVTMDMETFYTTAKNTDILIYNSTTSGEIHSVSELIAKNSLFKDFKAVKENAVWCTHNNLYQESMKSGDIIADFNCIFTDTAENNPPKFLYLLD